MNRRSFVALKRTLLAILLLSLGVYEGSAQQSRRQKASAASGMNQMSMSPFDMIKARTTPAQRKAAAANAAKRRATEAARQPVGATSQVNPNVPIGPPGSGGTLPTIDQLYFGIYPNYANSPLPQVTLDPTTGAVTGVVPGTGIRKFVDTLPGIPGVTSYSANYTNGVNDLGQSLPLAVPDTITFPGSDYYEIELNEFTVQMHADLKPTKVRGYRQTNLGTDLAGNNTVAPPPYQYLGPLIVATAGRPVRVKFANHLPVGAGGNLFIPVDQTVMGAGMGMANGMSNYLQNRATLHLHGGNTPWISDGTPHQWTVPAGDFANTLYPRGDSTQFVPDMFFVNGVVVPQCTATLTTNCSPAVLPMPNPSPLPAGATNDPGPGSMTFFWTNQQSARLMFYHDHAYGITRLNVYAGEAAGYLLLDSSELTMMGNGTVPPLQDTIPLVIQDKTFVPPNPVSAPVYSVGMLANGSGYNAATTGVQFAGGTCTTMPTANANVGNMLDPFGTLVINAVTSISLTSGGSCSVPPAVSIVDTAAVPGTGAAAFASLAILGTQDPTWDTALWGGPGNLWFPHFYMTNQWPDNPDGSGVNPMGRWDYAQWFWPPFGNGIYRDRGPIPCPSATNPAQQCPGFPTVLNPAPALDVSNSVNLGAGSTVSLTPEAFMDTPIVNGTAYPNVTLQPKAYRFRILSVGNDRTLNLSWFIACGTGGYTPAANATCLAPPLGYNGPAGTEVGMVPAAPTAGWPAQWPTDGRDGGVPDPAAMGPSWIQIGTEGGFLPKPTVIPPTPNGYEYFRRSVTVLNVSSHGLLLMPAERADVIVDFSNYAGKTLILYNDGAAPIPAFDPRYDYYTGDPDQTGTGGAPSTLAGYGPNTRTILRVVVAAGTPAPFNPVPLNTALPAAFKATQPTMIVPEAAYSTVYGTAFPNVYGKIADTSFTFTPIGGNTPVTVGADNKAIQELFELDYGRMNATLGTELKFTSFNNQTTIPLGYVDPTSEIIQDSANVAAQPVGTLGDGTQIWKVVHNGVDSHAIHFHLFNVQVINRVGWDGTVRPPAANELGWKDTVRMNPLEVIFVALRPTSQTLPWPIPDSIRKLDVTMPLGPDPALSNVGANGTAVPQTNVTANFGWEYVWHCHILGHEENDMMRPIQFQVPPAAPANLALRWNPWNAAGPVVNLYWTDMSASASQPGGGFNLKIATDAAFTTNLVTATVGGSAGFGSVLAYAFNATPGTPYYYEVQAFSANGISAWTTGFGPVQPALTAMTLTTNSPIIYGGVGVVTVTVTSPQGIPTGNVTLSVDGGAAILQALPGTNPDTAVFNLTGLAVGTHTLTANYPDVANAMITPSRATGTIVVNPAPLTITSPTLSVVYGSPVPTLTPTAAGLMNGDTLASLTGLTCTTTYVQGSPVSGSPYPVTCSGAVNANYVITYANTGTITVTPAPASVTPNPASKVYGAADPVPLTTGTLTGFLIPDNVTATYTRTPGETVAGSPYTISATLNAAPGVLANYTITYNTAAFTITPLAASVTPNPASKVYGTADPVFTGTLTGFLAADGVTATYSRTPGETVAGSPYTISATLAPAAVLSNYAITYNTAAFTITPLAASVTPNPATKVYGTADPAFTGTLSGFLAADGVTATYSRTPGETVLGSPYAISATLAPAAVLSNYTITYNTAAFTITPLAASVTPNAATKVYGTADPAFTGTLSGFLLADGVTATYSRTPGETVAGSPYTISATLAPAAVLSNYTITYNTALFTITPAPASVTPNPAGKVYGTADPALTGVLSGFLAADGVTATYSRTAGETVAGSPYTISATLNAGPGVLANYTITYNTALFTITAAPASVTPNAASKVYGAVDPALTGVLSGFLAADGVTATYSRTPGETVAGGPYTISATLNAAAGVLGNYVITYNTALFTITPAAASVTPNAAGKVYGAADPALTGTLTGFLAADGVTATYTRTAGETVAGSPYTISATLAPAAVLSNYSITYNTAQFTITPLAATVTPNAASKVYGSADPVLSGTLIGFLPADGVTATYSRNAGENVGLYTISATLGPAGVLGNYSITYNTASFTITPLAASVTPNPNSKIFGQPDPVPLTTGTLAGFLPADGVTATYGRNAGENVGTYAISVTLAPAAVLGNYTIAYNTAAFTISQATSATTITGNTPNPANLNQPVAVSFRVTPQFAGTPTGIVSVTASTGESCTGALSATGTGSCNLTFATIGPRTLTASYPGDANLLGSTSAGVSQVVVGPIAYVSPTLLPFGNQLVNTTSAPLTATLQNLGNAPLTINSITVAGTGFFRSGGGSCPGTTGTLAAGGSCTINVRFRPNAQGPFNGTLTIASNDPVNPALTVTLTGTGVAPVAVLGTLTPSPLVSTRGCTGAACATGTVSLTNAGTWALTINSISIGGANATMFGQTNNCGTSLAAGATCTITVTFHPPAGTTAGTKNATLRVRDNSNGVNFSLQTTALTGTAQ